MNDLHQRLLAAFDSEHRDHLEAVRRMLDGWEASGAPDALDVSELHRRLHSLKGAARAVGMGPVEGLAHELESFFEACKEGRVRVDPRRAPALRRALDVLEDTVAALMAGKSPPPSETAMEGLSVEDAHAVEAAPDGVPDDRHQAPAGSDPAPASGSLPALTRIQTGQFDMLIQCASDITVGLNDVGEVVEAVGEAERRLAALAAIIADPGHRRGRPRSEGDRATGVTGESLLAVSHLLSSAVRGHRQREDRLQRLCKRLLEQIGNVQTVTADSVFGNVRMIVRDVAEAEGKTVRTTVSGLGTQADRMVLQQLEDPLIHLLRNAVHHGIEMPEARRAAGKPKEGHVTLDLAVRLGQLVLSVEDDGAGVDYERVLDAARQRGLVDQGGVEDLGELLAAPGLSTEPTVGNFAGRGMGLSVVAETAARLGGTMAVGARAPFGTRVEIAVPTAILATRFALAEASGFRVALPIGRIARIHRVPAAALEYVNGRAFATNTGQAPLGFAPLADLISRSGRPVGDGSDAAAADPLVLIEIAGQGPRFAAAVDRVIGFRDGVMRSLGIAGEHAGAVAGGLVLPDSTVLPVLDTAALATAYAGSQRHYSAPFRAEDRDTRRRSILIADDSITTRTLEQGILEANGYRVRVSTDGAEALAQLREEVPDLVISDVEMPDLNGFGLLAAMKREPKLANVPVILVTSRSDSADRRRGLSLGASAYLVKQRFDQTELLKTVGRLL